MGVGDTAVRAETLPGMPENVGGNSYDESRLLSEQARLMFQASDDHGTWLDDYFALLVEGWSWRQAVYMVWASQPKPRTPSTEKELAVQVLGLTGARPIRHWKKDNPQMMLRIQKLQLAVLGKARAEVLEALVDSATTGSYRNYRDRELFLKMTGDYIPRERVDVAAVGVGDLGAMSAEELAALARIPVDRVAAPEDGDKSGGVGSEGAE